MKPGETYATALGAVVTGYVVLGIALVLLWPRIKVEMGTAIGAAVKGQLRDWKSLIP